jgi:L-threonylcarbamoyladenylate synthase
MHAIDRAARVLCNGGVIAYPTEGCFGLGCDPSNRRAVHRILRLKRRSPAHGLILIAASLGQLGDWIVGADPAVARARATWPGPVTWLLPARARVPWWIRGRHDTIAVRITAHPVARALCRRAGMAIVSTSANRHGLAPALSQVSVRRTFGDRLDMIVPGRTGPGRRPTEIRDGASGALIRAG